MSGKLDCAPDPAVERSSADHALILVSYTQADNSVVVATDSSELGTL